MKFFEGDVGSQGKVNFLRLSLEQISFLAAIKEFPQLIRVNRKFRTQMEFLSGLAGYYLLAMLKIGDNFTELQHWAGNPILVIEFLTRKPVEFLQQVGMDEFIILVTFLSLNNRKFFS